MKSTDQLSKQLAQWSLLFTGLVLVSLSLNDALGQLPSSEDFESPDALSHWEITGGIWQIGIPLSGPLAAHSGNRVAGTNLSGDYPEGKSSDLRCTNILIPPASSFPRLRFWHWYSFAEGDRGSVSIRVATESDQQGSPIFGEWQKLSGNFVNTSSGVWGRPSYDLRPYSGAVAELAFELISTTARNRTRVSTGWYIDDVSIETGPTTFENLTSFEDGLGDWQVTGGAWQVGEPTSGPNKAFTDSGVAATVLDGDYSDDQASGLQSPLFVVPPVTSSPRLRFQHWYSLAEGDTASVWIRSATEPNVDGTPKFGEWENLSEDFANSSSGVWVSPSYDLTKHAGATAEIEFWFRSTRAGGDTGVSSGWYIDDVAIETGPTTFDNLTSFEDGPGDWYVTRGAWQIGEPTSGPNKAFSGAMLAATVLDGDYSDDHSNSSGLLTPKFLVPPASNTPRLRFQHWYSMAEGDIARVFIRSARESNVDGTPKFGEWENLSGEIGNTSSGVWVSPSYDLTKHAGATAEIGFFFKSTRARSLTRVSSGWYIDDVSIETGSITLDNPTSFEHGIGDWSVSRGAWQVGKPTSGPNQAFSGSVVAATVLDGDYSDDQASGLCSPLFVIPPATSSPRLRFQHWYSLAEGDTASVWIRSARERNEDGTPKFGEWENLSGDFTNSSSGVWASHTFDITKHADATAQIEFWFHSTRARSLTRVSSGWYIDDIAIDAELLPSLPNLTIPECELFTFPLPSPNDPTLTVSLEGDSPAGATLSLGQLAWFPTEEQGPGDYEFTVVAKQKGNSLAPVDRETFTITVLETNKEPAITIPAPQPIQIPASALVSVPLVITDPDNNGGPYYGDIFQDQFGNHSLAGFEARSVTSNRNWETSQFGERSFAQINGIGADGPSDDWLIIPSLDLTHSENEALSFESAKAAVGADIEVMVSTSYRRGQALNRASWRPLSPELSEGNEVVVPSGILSLIEFTDSNNVSIAFRYESSGNTAEQAALWQIGNIRVKGLLPPLEQEIIITTDQADECISCTFDAETQQLHCQFTGCTEQAYHVTIRATDDGSPQARDHALSSATTLRFELIPHLGAPIVTRTQSGQISLQFKASTIGEYVIETSTDLINWSIQSTISVTDISIPVETVESPESDYQFFRFRRIE